MFDYKRVVVIGCPGAGKSTFSRKLHAVTNLPLFYLDALYWNKDCTHITRAELIEKQIPKKPYIDNDNGVYEKEYCPTCYRSLFPNDSHCKCGQAIDWSESE